MRKPAAPFPYARVERDWPGATVVILGSGPSLTVEDVACVRGRTPVIAVNNTFMLAPWADVLYACDARWWRWHWTGLLAADGTRGPAAAAFPGEKYALTPGAALCPGVRVLQSGGVEGISTDPTALCTGANSGYQAMNLAVLKGAQRLVLLGFDCQLGPHGREHYHADHPNRSKSPYPKFQRLFARVAPQYVARGITVINASRATALTCFPRVPLDAVLACAPQARVG